MTNQQGKRSIIEKINEDDRIISPSAEDWVELAFPSPQHRNSANAFRGRSEYLHTQEDFLIDNTFESDIVETIDGTDFGRSSEGTFEESERTHMKRMIQLLEAKCSESEKRNQELCSYIKKK
jgi:hypothetical protein